MFYFVIMLYTGYPILAVEVIMMSFSNFCLGGGGGGELRLGGGNPNPSPPSLCVKPLHIVWQIFCPKISSHAYCTIMIGEAAMVAPLFS